MLEVARLCALERASWQRGLRIIFWSGHSQGRYSSSSWYADQAWHELEKRAVAHVNVDSTGGKGNTIVADTTAAAELRQLAREAIESQGQQEFSGRRMQRAGDQSFWGIGVPSIFGNMSEQPAGGEANASAAVFGGNRRLGHGTGWWWHTPYDTLDKIDESILLRDTRIYLFVVWRLLTDEILPLDYAEHTAYLQEELESLQVSIGDHFNLSDLIDKTKALKSAADRFNTYRQPALQSKRVSLFNHCLCQLSRQLVPIDYTEGDRFEQDPALSQQVLPSLQPALGFRNLQPDEDTYKFLTVSMMRARNRVATSLDDALYLLQEANDALEEGGPNAPQYERLGPL
jgi:hypothetical protein